MYLSNIGLVIHLHVFVHTYICNGSLTQRLTGSQSHLNLVLLLLFFAVYLYLDTTVVRFDIYCLYMRICVLQFTLFAARTDAAWRRLDKGREPDLIIFHLIANKPSPGPRKAEDFQLSSISSFLCCDHVV